ncbi:VWA domain-containing protein [uncultured Treponema sp.]|uniref:VWA domain-containing protein n=1 Tax=uncultured Treponema sp. TaxID=162155 RepID=UPI0025F77E6B|nr:VWA domain-containing protein [uncultured Treponema sp.]
MKRKNRHSRKYSHKALKPISELKQKYPDGINDINDLSEEQVAWIQIKVQQFRECIKKVDFACKPIWWESMRLTRNKIAHQEENLSQEELSSLISTVSKNLEKIENDLNQNIKRYKQESKIKRKFENFSSIKFGSTEDKKQLVDAMEDYINPSAPEDVKIDFPKNKYSLLSEQILKELLNKKDYKSYVSTHDGIAENIQTDILEWLEKTHKFLKKEDPFKEEAIFIEKQKRLSSEDLASDLSNEKSKIEYHYKRLPSISESKRGDIEKSSVDFDFYKKVCAAEKRIETETNEKGTQIEVLKWNSDEKLEILKRNFISDLEKNFIDRKNKWELEQIEAKRKEFLDSLYSKIDNFIRIESVLVPFIKNLGRLWDLSEGYFETSGFEILGTFAELLEKDESLQELSELLGKQSRSQSIFEKEMREKVALHSNWQPKKAYRGEINGLKYSNDISVALPSELSLMKNPALNKLFQLKFAQKQLLSYDYQIQEESDVESKEKEEVEIEKKEKKGPIIVCVDTSGSMNGTPENIAKTITFALSKIAIEEDRKCYVISFSTDIQTLDLSDFSSNPIGKLVQFLRMSFNGGTDAVPALNQALKMLSENEWKNADVLMISDFVMQSLDKELADKIESEKKKNTVFYSLTIGNSGNKETIQCFNHNWFYDMNNPQAARHLAEQLNEVRKHNTSETEDKSEL